MLSFIVSMCAHGKFKAQDNLNLQSEKLTLLYAKPLENSKKDYFLIYFTPQCKNKQIKKPLFKEYSVL